MFLKDIFVKIKNSNTSRHMVLSGLCKPIAMVVSLIYVRVVLSFLGVENYGVWSTLLTILSWVSYFDIGIGNGLRNRLTEAISNGKKEDCKKLISSAYAFIAIIMIALAVIVVIIAQFIDWKVIFGVSDDFAESLSAIVSISIAFVAGNFILSICRNVLYAIQKASIVSVLELITQVVNLVLIFIIRAVMTSNILMVAIVYGCSMIAVNVVCSIVIYLRNKDLMPNVKTVDFSIGKNLTSLGMKFFIIQICALILYSTDSLMISYIYGASDVTPYATVNKVFTAISSMYLAFIVPIWSAFTKANAEKNYVSMKKSIWKLQLFMIPFVVVAIILTIFFKPITKLWLGQELDYVFGLIPLGFAYCLLTIWTNTYASVGNGLELMKISMAVAVLQAVLNIPFSYLFAEVCGYQSAGVLAGTVLVMAISAVIMPIYIHIWIGRKLKLPICETTANSTENITDTSESCSDANTDNTNESINDINTDNADGDSLNNG